jgi:hypothetical protein
MGRGMANSARTSRAPGGGMSREPVWRDENHEPLSPRAATGRSVRRFDLESCCFDRDGIIVGAENQQPLVVWHGIGVPEVVDPRQIVILSEGIRHEDALKLARVISDTLRPHDAQRLLEAVKETFPQQEWTTLLPRPAVPRRPAPDKLTTLP